MTAVIDEGQMEAWRKAQQYARWLWNRGQPATRKQLGKARIPFPVKLRELSGSILVPMRDEGGELWAVQSIQDDFPACSLHGFQLHARIQGLSHRVGDPVNDKVGVTIRLREAAWMTEEEGCPTAVAFTPENLEPIALSLKRRHPGARVVVWAMSMEDEPIARTAAKAAGVEFAPTGDIGLIFSAAVEREANNG